MWSFVSDCSANRIFSAIKIRGVFDNSSFDVFRRKEEYRRKNLRSDFNRNRIWIRSIRNRVLTPEEKEAPNNYAGILLGGLNVEQVERTNLVNVKVAKHEP